MRGIIGGVVCVSVALFGLIGCAQNQALRESKGDPIITGYMKERSNLLQQRRKLVGVYGSDSPTVAEMDRQVRLVDDAIATRRQQVMEDEAARQEVKRLKSDGPSEVCGPAGATTAAAAK